jgi:hypothetical protein
MKQPGVEYRQPLGAEEIPALATTGTTVRRHHDRIRRVASLFQASSSPSGPPSSTPVTPTSSRNSSGVAGESAAARAETERVRGLRGKWSMGGDAATVALTPVVVDLRMGGQDQDRKPGAGATGGENGSLKSRKGKEKEKKGWGWGGWWP